MIPSASTILFYLRGSVHDESTVLVVFVGVTALEPPIHLSLFADADIGLGPPRPHPRPLRWWDISFGIYLFLVLWKYFWETVFLLAEVYLLSGLPFFFFCFGYIYLIVALVPFVFWVLPCIS